MHRHITLSLLAHLLASSAFAAEGPILSPAAEISGVTQAEWSARWWQWAFSFDRARSPVADRTGELCASRQTGDVWFLAGTYGTRRVQRTCTVPFGKTLFFPLVNYVAYRGDGSNEGCMSLAVRAASYTNEISALVLELDGKRHDITQAHRQATACFSFVPGTKPDAVSNGYYVALAPLPRGTHTLNFGGVLPTLMQAVTYTLVVE